MSQNIENPQVVGSNLEGQKDDDDFIDYPSMGTSWNIQKQTEEKAMTESFISIPSISQDPAQLQFNVDKLAKTLENWGFENKPGFNWEYFNSANDRSQLQAIETILGFPLNNKTDAVAIPFLDTEGNQVLQDNGKPYARFRILKPLDPKRKYESPKESGLHLYFSPTVTPETWASVKDDKNTPLILVEGEKKAEYLNQLLSVSETPLAYAIGLCGIWGWVVGNQTIKKNVGLGYLLEAISGCKDDHLKKALTALKDDPRKEMMEVLEAWHEMQVIAKVNKQTTCKPIEEKLADWLYHKETQRTSTHYKAALDWDLDEALEGFKANMSDNKHAAMVAKVTNQLTAQVDTQQEGHTISPELQQFKLHGRTVLICFDSDIYNGGIGLDGHYVTGSIAGAARSLAIELTKLEASPKMLFLPKPVSFQDPELKKYSDRLDKMGVDDYGLAYGQDAVIGLVEASLNSEALALMTNKDEPLASRKYLRSYKLNLTPSNVIYECWLKYFLRNRVNLAYRDNNAMYQWTGKHWEKLVTEFKDLTTAKAYLQTVTGKKLPVSKSELIEATGVSNDVWNHKGDEWVLYSNGSYNFSTGQFKPGFAKSDYCTFAPIPANYKQRHEFKPDTLEALVKFVNFCSGGDPKFLQYMLAAIRWTNAPKDKYKQLPVEKFFSMVGDPGSGKSTYMTMIKESVGADNCRKITQDKLDTPEGLAQYVDKKMLFNSDASGGVNKNAIENINMMVSGETMEVRVLFKQSYEANMKPVIWMAGNEIFKYGITGTQGASRRLVTIPIEHNGRVTVDPYLAQKVTSEEFQSALFYLYRQLNDQDMIAILNHDRYLPDTIRRRTVAQGIEQNPIRQFWQHLTDKKVSEISNIQLMDFYREWAKINNQYDFQSVKIVNELKAIHAIEKVFYAGSKNQKQHSDNGRVFNVKPYQDHTTLSTRLTYAEDNGRPLVIINPYDYLPAPPPKPVSFLERILALPSAEAVAGETEAPLDLVAGETDEMPDLDILTPEILHYLRSQEGCQDATDTQLTEGFYNYLNNPQPTAPRFTLD